MIAPLVSEITARIQRDGISPGVYAGRRILVTGGAGFIGSWLVHALASLGAVVYVVDNLWRGSLRNLDGDDRRPVFSIAERFLQEDLRDYSATRLVFGTARPEIVFHLADVVAGIDFVMNNEPLVYRANTLINSNTFAAAAEVGVPQLVYLGTACSYPRHLQARPGGTPLVEEQTYPADPESAYGWSKLLGEYEAQLLGANSDTEVGILRAHNVYGPRALLSRGRSQVIPSLIRKAIRFPDEPFVVWGSGAQARDFLYVGDVVDALLRMPPRGMSKGVIQVSSGVETSVAELASMIVRLSQKPITATFDRAKPEGDAGRSGNPAKAARVLDWRPSTSLHRGLTMTYDWALAEIRANPGILDD